MSRRHPLFPLEEPTLLERLRALPEVLAVYPKLDVRVPMGARGGAQLFGRNLEGHRPLTYGSFISAGPDDIFNWSFGAPSVFGARFMLDF